MKSKKKTSRRQLTKTGLLTAPAKVAGDLMGRVRATKGRAARPVRFETIAEGFVDKRNPKRPLPLAVGPRAAVTKEGDLVCSYGLRSQMAGNETVPVIARSRDGGLTWGKPTLLWPHLQGKEDIYGSVSRSPECELFFYGAVTPMNKPGGTVHQAENEGMKQNEVYWAKSSDSGRTWTEPAHLKLPIPGAAEAPGAMCVTRRGRWLACYSPYNTFDPELVVDRNQVVVMRSDDRGKSWRHTSMLRFPQTDSCAAEAWVVELTNGRLLGTSWHVNLAKGGKDYPNTYALSLDGGATWKPTRDTGIVGQSTALAPLPDGRALFIYNQRKHGEVGVWLALVKPTLTSFGIQANQPVWRAEKIAQKGSSGDFASWEDFAFGEPSVTLLPDGTLFVAIWCVQPSGQGIRYVKLKMVS